MAEHDDTVAAHLAHQGRTCARLGSPLYGDLLDRAARDPDVLALLHAGAPSDHPDADALGLRLLGAVHRLVLAGDAPDLAAHYPSAGGVPGRADAVWAAFAATVGDHRDAVVRGLAGPPQTNEVGRSAPLLGALTVLTARTGLPVHLVEPGASAGLNLRPDRVRCADRGPVDSPVDLGAAWTGSVLPPGAPVLARRTGADPAALDPTDADDARVLRSWVWPDQHDRRARLDGAIALAVALPVAVGRETASALLARTRPEPGVLTVVWHSIVRQYLDADERAAVDAALERLAGAATPDAPVAHVALEPRRVAGRTRFPVVVRLWPGAPEETVLGAASPHGPVVWGPAASGPLRPGSAATATPSTTGPAGCTAPSAPGR